MGEIWNKNLAHRSDEQKNAKNSRVNSTIFRAKLFLLSTVLFDFKSDFFECHLWYLVSVCIQRICDLSMQNWNKHLKFTLFVSLAMIIMNWHFNVLNCISMAPRLHVHIKEQVFVCLLYFEYVCEWFCYQNPSTKQKTAQNEEARKLIISKIAHKTKWSNENGPSLRRNKIGYQFFHSPARCQTNKMLVAHNLLL